MNSETFLKAIGLGEPYLSAVAACPVSEEEAISLPASPYLDAHYEGPHPEKMLALFVRYLSEYSEEAYHVRGIGHADWLMSMTDVAVWARALMRESGEIGLRETGWLAHLVRTEIFRLGRLQFIPRTLQTPRVYGREYPAGTPYCEVHIPVGGPLLPAEADASFRAAEALFSPALFTCDSWLLSPRLRALVPHGNIADFSARFTLLSVDETSRSAERYIFGRVGDPHGYTAETSLARAVKAEVLAGRPLGTAYGYIALS